MEAAECLPGSPAAVALTFDDGPDPRFTPGVLAALGARGTPATFFVMGEQAARHPELVARLRDAGMQIGIHSWDHRDLWGRGRPFVRDQLLRAVAVLTDLGVTPTLFRPPFGFTDDDVLAAAAEVGLRTVRWSVDSHDWEQPPAADIVSRVAAGLHPGAIILLHDGGGDRSATVAAVPLVVAAVEAAGMWCDDLSSLAYR